MDEPGAAPGPIGSPRPEVPDETVAGWQYIVDAVTRRLGVPVGLIMRVVGPDLEVLVSNGDDRNPHAVGERAGMSGLGVYRRRVMEAGAMLCVPTPTADDVAVAGNPGLARHDVSSYLGFPIRWPDGGLFGTLCVLEQGEHDDARHHREVLSLMRDLIESNLRTLYAT